MCKSLYPYRLYGYNWHFPKRPYGVSSCTPLGWGIEACGRAPLSKTTWVLLTHGNPKPGQPFRERIFVGNNTWCTQPGKLEPDSELVCWKNNCDYGKSTLIGWLQITDMDLLCTKLQCCDCSVMKVNCAAGILTSCTSICKYKLTTVAFVLQSVLNYNCSSFSIFLYIMYI